MKYGAPVSTTSTHNPTGLHLPGRITKVEQAALNHPQVIRCFVMETPLYADAVAGFNRTVTFVS
jgi:hypothetical protein